MQNLKSNKHAVDKPVTIHGAVNDGCLANCNNYVTFFADTGEVQKETTQL